MMISIKATYQIPGVKHLFFIAEVLSSPFGYSKESPKHKKRKGYFEHILRSKDHNTPKESQQWILKIVPVNDFLSDIERNTPKELISSNQSLQNPEKLELLAINLIKTPPSSSDCTFKTPKALCVVPDEDIIEVFI